MPESMENRIEEIREALSHAASDEALQELRVKYLGKKGFITGLMKQMRDLAPRSALPLAAESTLCAPRRKKRLP